MRKTLYSLALAFLLLVQPLSGQIAPGIPPASGGLDENPSLALGTEDTPGADDRRVTVTVSDVSFNVYRVWISTAGACLAATTDATLTEVSGTAVIDTHQANGHLVYVIGAGPAVFNLNIAGAVTRYFNLEYQGRCVSTTVTWAS